MPRRTADPGGQVDSGLVMRQADARWCSAGHERSDLLPRGGHLGTEGASGGPTPAGVGKERGDAHGARELDGLKDRLVSLRGACTVFAKIAHPRGAVPGKEIGLLAQPGEGRVSLILILSFLRCRFACCAVPSLPEGGTGAACQNTCRWLTNR